MGKFRRTTAISVRIIFRYLALNTGGNSASSVTPERRIFAPKVAILALFALKLAIEKN